MNRKTLIMSGLCLVGLLGIGISQSILESDQPDPQPSLPYVNLQAQKAKAAELCRSTQLSNPFHDCSQYDDIPMSPEWIKSVYEMHNLCVSGQIVATFSDLSSPEDCSGYDYLQQQIVKNAARHGR